MCKISFERCICLAFLIISLVVLICSGIPIDNADMSPSSKRYFSSSPSSYGNVFLKRNLGPRSNQDRMRHFRAQTRDLRTHKKPTGHIEATVYQNLKNDSITSDLTIPMSLTNKPVRSQRSSGNSRHRIKTECQPEHFSMKAYKSDIVLRVKAQGIERTNYTVSFLLNENFPEHRLKVPSSVPIHECLTLQFSNRTRNCRRARRGRKNLVKADIKVSDEYIVFLNITDDNKCTPSFPPERISELKKKQQNFMMRILKKVCSDGFKVKKAKIELKEDTKGKEGKRKIKLICRTEGLPVPSILWKHNNKTLVNNEHTRIHYVKKRSVLVIKDPVSRDYGHYQCLARGVDGSEDSQTITVSHPTNEARYEKTKCPDEKKDYCMSGTCYTDYNNQYYCECDSGYKGARCDQKDTIIAISSSRYHEKPLFACKLGVATKYFCLED